MSATIKIHKKGKEYTVEGKKGETLLTVLNKNGYSVKHPCGGKGKCGKCLVQVTDTNAKPNKLETELLGKKKMAEGYRVACLVRSDQPMTVHFDGKALKAEKKVGPNEHIQKEPDLKIQTALAKHFFGQGEIGYTEVRRDGRLVGVERGDTRTTSFGVAISIEGTRVYAALCSLTTGEIITRMESTRTSTIQILISDILEKLLSVSGLDRKWLYEVVIVPDVIFWHAFLVETEQMSDNQSTALLRMPLSFFGEKAAMSCELSLLPAPVIHAGLPAIVAAYRLTDRKKPFLLLLRGGDRVTQRKGKLLVKQLPVSMSHVQDKSGAIDDGITEIFVDTGMLGTDVAQILASSGLSAYENSPVIIFSNALDHAARSCLLSKKCMKHVEELIESVSLVP